MVDVDAAGGTVPPVVLVVLLVFVLPAPLRDEPPVVEVSVVPAFDVPPPVAPLLLEPVFELALELPAPAELELVFALGLELELELVVELFDDDALALLDAVVCEVGLAALVVGTVSGGAPVVSLLLPPLPPHAASTVAAATAAAHALRPRRPRLRFR